MKGGTIQINWHGSDPVLTVDFHRLSGLLATGGADHDIKLWTLNVSEGAPLPSADFHSSLSYHTSAVNVVRFSAAGDQLASGADGGEILLWKLNDNNDASNIWKLSKNLRFHVKDVLDLQWSLDGTLLISGSVDNTVIVWDAVKGNPHQILKDHMHYVQGVAWDPIGQYIASISGDRTCRIYCSKIHNPKGKSQDKNSFSCQNVLVKAELPKEEEDATVSKTASASATAPPKQNLFHDETLASFFRRLEWSPDGSFLLVPAGVHKFPSESTLTNTAFIVSRKDLSRPAMQLPGASKPIVAVRFCPVVFSLNPNLEQTICIFNLPYRIVFAVASLNSIYIYDTQSTSPLAILAGIHYAAITDIAWSWDAKYLAVSSQDGFCSLVTFDPEELGPPIASSDLPTYVAEFLPIAKEVTTMVQLKSAHGTEKVQNKDSNGNSLQSQSGKHKKDFDEKGYGQPEMQDQNRKNTSQAGERTSKVVGVNSNSQPKRITPIPQDAASVNPRRITPIPQDATSVKPKRITATIVNVESGNNVETEITKEVVSEDQQKESKDVTGNEHGGHESMEVDSSVGTAVVSTEDNSGFDKKTRQHLSGRPVKQRRITPVAMTPVQSDQTDYRTDTVKCSIKDEPAKAVPPTTNEGNTVVERNTETGSPAKQRRIIPIAITSSDPEKQGSDGV